MTRMFFQTSLAEADVFLSATVAMHVDHVQKKSQRFPLSRSRYRQGPQRRTPRIDREFYVGNQQKA